jgi:hypothetical protein
VSCPLVRAVDSRSYPALACSWGERGLVLDADSLLDEAPDLTLSYVREATISPSPTQRGRGRTPTAASPPPNPRATQVSGPRNFACSSTAESCGSS